MGSDPRRPGRTRLGRGRQDHRQPGWTDSLLAGRSRADKEAEHDALVRVMAVLGVALVLALLGLHALFRAVGLQLGWWSAPVFAPMLAWLAVSAGLRRSLRPVELDELRWHQRLGGTGVLAVVLWACWPLWADPAARAWKAAHGGFHGIAGPGARYPIHAIIAASPLAMGLVAFLLLALAVVLAPRVGEREPEQPAPPAGPEPLRAALLLPRHGNERRWP